MIKTVSENKYFQQKYLTLFKSYIETYELIKAKKHPQFNHVIQFYKFHNIDHRIFLKYYKRYKINPCDTALMPEKRGPKYKTRRTLRFIENKVIEHRMLGNNKYEIYSILKPILKDSTPSVSCIYLILKRYSLNRLKPKMKQNKRTIITNFFGELGHIDCHHVNGCIINSINQKPFYILALLDDYSRITLCEIIKNVKSLTAMFATLKSINLFNELFNIKFKEILSDNGPEFGNKFLKDKDSHPFEKLLIELGIKHRYTLPYRPQTNGKIERFWKTLHDDLIDGTTFDSLEHFAKELTEYIVYYNYQRPHQALNGNTPVSLLDNVKSHVLL